MDVYTFYRELGKKCTLGGCEGCAARDLCYTAPHSVTDEIIDQVIEKMELPIYGYPMVSSPDCKAPLSERLAKDASHMPLPDPQPQARHPRCRIYGKALRGCK